MAASPKSKQGSEGAERVGLTTVEALAVLKQQLEKVLADHQLQQENRPRSLAWQRSFLHHGNRWSCFHLLGALLMLVAGMLLLCCHGGQPQGSEGAELVNGLALLTLLGVNLYVMGRQARLKDTEIPRRLRSLLDGIGDTLRECGESRPTPWEPAAYPDLLMPHSKAVAVQWAYRDGALVNLPLSLLVEGDVISLRPGQDAPVHLRGIKDEEHLLLAPGDLFLRPSPLASPVPCDRGRPHATQKPRQFRVTRTPVLESVRKCLEGGTGRPVSVLDNECFATRTLLHRYVVPATLLLLLITNALRFILKAPGIGSTVYTFIQLQVNGVLPLLPLIFPGLWVLVNAYGEAKVLAQFSKAPPTPLEMYLCEWSHFTRVLRGRSPALCQTGSLLHNLGSVTVLCCVDKQGVLSWANPSPEKVVFFSSQPGPEPGYDDDDDDDKDDVDVDDEEMGDDGGDGGDEAEEPDEAAGARTRKAAGGAVPSSLSAVRLLEAEWPNFHETESLLPPSADIERGPDRSPRPLEGRRSCATPPAAAATASATAVTTTTAGATLTVGSSPRCCPATPSAKPAGATVVSFCQCVEGGAGEPEKERRRDGLEVEAIAELEEEEEDEATTVERGQGDAGDADDGETDDFVCDYRLEVLSLSQDQQNPASVQFDDARWPLHATSLKPLGLNVLLTACNAPLAPHTLRLCDHLAQAARAGRAASSCLPTRPPWGLCELPRIIGFTPGAKDVFSVESYLALFQLPSGELLPPVRDRARRLSAVVKRRLPLGHLVSLLVKDLNSGNLQLLSHGTADVVLDACTAFWDGFDIYPLSASDRKKVLDFYQRTCLSGYCVAFAYKPMHRLLAPELDRRCVELPPGHDPFGAAAASANAAAAALSAAAGQADNPGSARRADTPGHTPVKTSGTRKNSWSSDEGIGEGTERGEGAERGEGMQALAGQIFMGLVSAQYQARLDIVRLVDGLDSACIRFVYFSLEDELRSKVFAEKMGLESGWNCHISLQSSGYDLGTDAPPHSPSQASSLHDHAQQEGEVQMLLEEETHSDVVSYPPTDSDAPSILEYSNRAKLPRGIENVRPHLENIDNVPLLVPLFTDCTPDTMCEMVAVMQEYGEVVCCLGSSANVRNGRVFLQSNVSIAVDPLYPSRCTWERFGFAPSGMPADTEAQDAGPLRLSGQLNGLPCSVAFHHEENLSIIKLIKQARHTINGMRKCFLFLLQCQLSLVLLQVVSCLFQLPPPLSTTDVLWMSCVSHPLISVTLLGKQPDTSVMTIATGKNLMVLPRRTVHYYVFCFLGKFLPSVCIYLCCFALTLQGFCQAGSQSAGSRNDTQCSYPFSRFDGMLWFGEYSNALLLAQKITAGFLLLNSLCVLVTHVHRTQPLWRHSPFTNTWWTAMVPLLLVLQAVQAAVDLQLWRNTASPVAVWLADVPIATWLLGFLWLVPLVVINELIKLHEIRMRVRYQKRQKLQFETKLGMNSPF